jgi:hypothetical protein
VGGGIVGTSTAGELPPPRVNADKLVFTGASGLDDGLEAHPAIATTPVHTIILRMRTYSFTVRGGSSATPSPASPYGYRR